MKTGLYIGRFQPFHLGHLSAVKQALKEVDRLIIGIGSSQYSDRAENPLTAVERAEVIQHALKEAGIQEKDYKIVEIPDIHDNPKWPAHVRKIIAEFDILFVGDDGIVKKLFESFDAVPIKIVKRELDISASRIREAIKAGKPWKDFVSQKTLAELQRMDFEKRIRILNV